jgi:hypothetical protein
MRILIRRAWRNFARLVLSRQQVCSRMADLGTLRHMFAWSRKLALVLALAAMPLQGVTAVLTVLLCHGDARAHAMHVPDGHNHGDAGHDGHHGAAQDEGSAALNAAYHLCCNMTVSVPPSVIVPAVVPNFPVRASAPHLLHDLFIPDRPQRPPLA